jgi:hypothetical protein
LTDSRTSKDSGPAASLELVWGQVAEGRIFAVVKVVVNVFGDLAARRRSFNRRRERDPLGEGQACTWRMRLIKVAARVVQTTRRIVVRLSGSRPHLDHYYRVSEQVLDFSLPAPDSG